MTQQPPSKSHTLRTVLLSVVVGVAAVIGVFAGCTTFFATTTPTDTGHTQVAADNGGGAQPKETKKKPAAKPTHDPTKYGYWYDAKKDVNVDGLANGSFDDQYVAFSVTNQSDTKLDYTVTFGYYNAQGERIGEDYAYINSVNPGEKVRATEYDTSATPGASSARVLSADAMPS